MKVIIAGSRSDIIVYSDVKEAIKLSGFEITEIFSGSCPRGVDKLGERYARENSIPLRLFPANWTKYGKAAGPVRNNEMAMKADALIAVWDGHSRGTWDMMERARSRGLRVYVHQLE